MSKRKSIQFPVTIRPASNPGNYAVLVREPVVPGYILEVYHADILVFEVGYCEDRGPEGTVKQAESDAAFLVRGELPQNYFGSWMSTEQRIAEFNRFSIGHRRVEV